MGGGRVFAVSATVLALAVPATTATGAAGTASVPLPPAAYLQPGNYANTPLVSFTARDVQPLYTDALKQGCTRAAQVDAALATGKSNGNGVLLGTANGATVVAEDVWEFAKLAEVAKLINEARSSPECVAYAAADPFNRIYAQYPQVPPLPTLGPTVEKNDYAAFAGTTMSSPQASGAAALIRSGKRVARVAFRTANQTPDQVVPLRDSLFPSAWYFLGAAMGAGTDPDLQARVDRYAAAIQTLQWYQQFAMQATQRGAFPDNPASCHAATDAYVFSGFESALRELTGQDPATRVGVRTQISVYPRARDAARYLAFANDLSSCFEDLYSRNLSPGSKVEVERIPKKGTAKDGEARGVQYLSTLTGADGATIGEVGVDFLAVADRAAFLFVQRASGDPAFDVATELDKMEADLAKVLAGK